jgi:GNAT superfamily N-acetyltransferase
LYLGSELRFQAARPEDAAAFCALSNSLYARKVDEAYFHWQFFACPHRPFAMLAWRGEDLVGAFGVHVVAGPGAPRAMSLDIMIASEAQGQGIIAPLTEAATQEARARGAQIMAVVANERARKALGARLAWNAWRSVSDWTGANRATVGAPACHAAPRRPAAAFSTASTFYPRDGATLDWRTSTPRYQHIWLEIADLGHAVVKSFKDPTSGAGFGDILALFPHGSEATESCLLSVQAWLANQGIGQAAIYPTTAAERAACERLSFSPSSRLRHFCGIGDDPDDLAIGMLDVDVY